MEVRVGIAESHIARYGTKLKAIGLGSCVAIILHSNLHKTGSMAHIMLPEEISNRDTDNAAKFASTAVRHMLLQLSSAGVDGTLEARIVGGASMFAQLLPPNGISLGSRNIFAARTACMKENVPIVGEDTGGEYGRTAVYDPDTGQVLITSFVYGERWI